jgi:nitrate/nitrite transport system ATP-binding protein
MVRIGKSELVIASVSSAQYDETKQASWPGLSRPSTSS